MRPEVFAIRTGLDARHLVRHILHLAVLLMMIAAGAARACTLPDNYLPDVRPGLATEPTRVSLGMGMTDVLGVDDVNQQMDVDFFVRMEWTDPRLAALAGCRFPVTEIWFPEIYILNSSQLTQKRRNARNDVSVEDGGQVVYVNRLTGGVSTYHNLSRFPFDTQVFQIEISVPESDITEVVLIPNYERTWLGDKLNIEGWDFESIRMDVADTYLEQLQRTVSVATVSLEAKRNSNYYIYRILLLLTIVVAMSWVIFWVPPGRYEFQIGICATAMLTTIAFNFSISSVLPRVAYLTVMDRLVIWAVVLIFLATVQALITTRLIINKREKLALTFDHISRYLFPTLFFAGWYLIIVAL